MKLETLTRTFSRTRVVLDFLIFALIQTSFIYALLFYLILRLIGWKWFLPNPDVHLATSYGVYIFKLVRVSRARNSAKDVSVNAVFALRKNFNFSTFFIQTVCKLKKKSYQHDRLLLSTCSVINPCAVDHCLHNGGGECEEILKKARRGLINFSILAIVFFLISLQMFWSQSLSTYLLRLRMPLAS